MQGDRRGRLIVFEGGDGSGKSTQASLLAAELGALATREPGGTVLGEQVRALLLDPDSVIADRAEALLMAAARSQHVADVIEPALASGRHVVCDRFIASSVAYQGYGRGLDPDEVARISKWATAGLQADLTILLEVAPAVAEARVGSSRDRLESAGEAFHRSVLEGFRAQAAADPDRWIVIDGDLPVAAVAKQILDAVTDRFG